MNPGTAAELFPLAESVSPEDLERIFGAFGKVSAVDIQKRSGTRIVVITYASRWVNLWVNIFRFLKENVSRMDCEEAIGNLDCSEVGGTVISLKQVVRT